MSRFSPYEQDSTEDTCIPSEFLIRADSERKYSRFQEKPLFCHKIWNNIKANHDKKLKAENQTGSRRKTYLKRVIATPIFEKSCNFSRKFMLLREGFEQSNSLMGKIKIGQSKNVLILGVPDL